MESIYIGKVNEVKAEKYISRFVKSDQACMKITFESRVNGKTRYAVPDGYAFVGRTEGDLVAYYLINLKKADYLTIKKNDAQKNTDIIIDWLNNAKSEVALVNCVGFSDENSARASLVGRTPLLADNIFVRRRALYVIKDRGDTESKTEMDTAEANNENIVISMMAELEERIVKLEKGTKALAEAWTYHEENKLNYDRFMESLQNSITLYLPYIGRYNTAEAVEYINKYKSKGKNNE